ncbi:leucyl aminopeptidase [Maritalea mediterranea]|uniref:Probable cytosol aminopeptidase n=1 Tax=Maritalea mediterranea TaxID=2909667 RepID=A0ABS9E5H1_9HYPH|nr:leucyl aminopeptidase [Maritalea mediterranea]MCF4098097.1 leucyl aminopeptidase [Maritalea mediterranea]
MGQKLTIAIVEHGKGTGKNIVITANADLELTAKGHAIWEKTGLDLSKLAQAAGFKGKSGTFLPVLAPQGLDADVLLVAGVEGLSKDSAKYEFADFGGKLIDQVSNRPSNTTRVVLNDDLFTAPLVAEVAAGIKLSQYRFDKYKTKKNDDDTSSEIDITLETADAKAATAAHEDRDCVTAGTIFARDLVNEPANILGTLEFAEAAKSLEADGLEVELLDEAKMKELGMGALLGVAQGSVRPPRLAIMKWNGGAKDEAPVAFIGKGVVFDSGGLSIKPAGGMEDMKGDMGGAGAVAGLMKTVALRKPKINVIGVIGLVENMLDANAQRPGDIVTSMSGQTIEVLNTDAEGRLVLADALWYTKETFKPKFMVNLATLTGANLVALGNEHAGLFSNDDQLAERITAAGLETNEKVWRFPMGPAYDKLIDSKNADMKNIGGRWAGAITAAQFLKRFVGDTKWAHLDLSTAMNVPSTATNKSWATGFGVYLLDQMVRNHYE